MTGFFYVQGAKKGQNYKLSSKLRILSFIFFVTCVDFVYCPRIRTSYSSHNCF
nr:MAG TPA: hypothetical protein [Caudoviricetes sp.]